MLKSLDIRGFAANQTLSFAIPDEEPGSGLTVIVGANNAGKSTAIEALLAVAQQESPSFTQGRRNQVAGDQVFIRAVDTEGQSTTLESIRAGSSETRRIKEGNGVDIGTLLILPARRVFSPYFACATATRDAYMARMGFPTTRASALDVFTHRLFSIENNRASFDSVLKRVVDPVPDWSIDQADNGQYFLKIGKGAPHIVARDSAKDS